MILNGSIKNIPVVADSLSRMLKSVRRFIYRADCYRKKKVC